MVFDLTVRIGKKFESAVPDSHTMLEALFDLTCKEQLVDLVLVKVLVFMLGHKHDPGEVVLVFAVLAHGVVSRLSLQGQHSEQGWRLQEPVL